MARVRLITPGAPVDEDVATMSLIARYVWAYLPCHADKEGRLRDAPFTLRLAICPLDKVDMEEVLCELAIRRHIVRYEIDGRGYIQIRNFAKYQKPHRQEKESGLPGPISDDSQRISDLSQRISDVDQRTSEPSAPDPVSGSGCRILDSGEPPRPHDLPWPAWRWYEKFKIAWAPVHRKVAYGDGEDDARATGELEDKLNSIPGFDRLKAQGEADVLFKRYFAIQAAGAHPWKWFVQRLNELRAGPVMARPPPRGGSKVDHGQTIENVKDWVEST